MLLTTTNIIIASNDIKATSFLSMHLSISIFQRIRDESEYMTTVVYTERFKTRFPQSTAEVSL
jgi:hypothetical protein